MNKPSASHPTLPQASPTAGSGTTPSFTTGTTAGDWRATTQEILDFCAVPEHLGWAFRDDQSGKAAKAQPDNAATPGPESGPGQTGVNETSNAGDATQKPACEEDPDDVLAGFEDLFEDDLTPFRALARRHNPRAGRLPRVLPLLSALQLARRFGSIAHMRSCLTGHGEIVVLASGQPQGDDILVKVLYAVLRPQGQSGTLPDPLIRTAAKTAEQSRTHDDHAFHGLSPEMRDAIEAGRPILIVAGSGIGLSKDLQALAPTVLALPALDVPLLRAMLHILYPGDNSLDDSALASLAVLDPSNGARPHVGNPGCLDIEDLVLAFRAPSAEAVVARLARTLAPRTDTATTQPGLAEFPLPPDARAAIDQLLADLHDWRSGTLAWDAVSRGLLLVGPPGCGKTEIPRLIARDAKIAVHATSLSRLQSGGARSSELMREMHSLFQKAAAEAPCIVFIDELDAFGDRGRPRDHNSSYTDNIVTGLLECLDGFAILEGVVVIAATNHVDKIDAALQRPGRFDRQLTLGAPGPEQLPAAFRWHLGDTLADDDLNPVVAAAIGMSGAAIARTVRSARATARAAGRALCLDDLGDAIAETHPPLAPDLRYRVAVHEAGHAIVSRVTGHGSPRLLAIHTAGGWADVGNHVNLTTRADIETALAMMLAGRAAERLILRTIGSGSGGPTGSDLARATILAAGIEVSFGLGQQTLWRAAPEDALALLNRDPDLRQRAQAHLDRAETRALHILRRSQSELRLLAASLAEHTILTGAALDALMQAIPLETDEDPRANTFLQNPSKSCDNRKKRPKSAG
jgi:hypothetical protein